MHQQLLKLEKTETAFSSGNSLAKQSDFSAGLPSDFVELRSAPAGLKELETGLLATELSCSTGASPPRPNGQDFNYEILNTSKN